jgi:predicted phosphodiesterase
MRKTILHLSDLHFGAPQAPDRAEAILAEIKRRTPTVVAISGDLTQRARTSQFRQARQFLDRIGAPVIVVPGNHDVPLWNVVNRFLLPLEKYRQWITDDLNPLYIDEALAVMGLDTTRSFTIKGGRINQAHLSAVRGRLCELPDEIGKVIVAHHPFAPPPGFERERAVGGVRRAVKLLAKCRVEIILTGHLHQYYVANSREFYPDSEPGILLVQAGTVVTLMGRGAERHKNSFNLIDVTEDEIKVINHIYSDEDGAFIAAGVHVSPRHQFSPVH